MTTPTLTVMISPHGVGKVEILYRASQHSDAWQLCQDYLPWLLKGARSETQPNDHRK
jgi:hypothetical protein